MDSHDERNADRRDAFNSALSTTGWTVTTAAILLFAIGLMVTAGASAEENMFVPAGFMWFVFGVLALLAAISVWVTLAVRVVLRRFGRL
jgi:vacuolar-type H+-ATPase subunit I/STV1